MSETTNLKPADAVRERAHRIGLEIETSVAQDNFQEYRLAMTHASEFIKANPEQRDAIHDQVMAQFERDHTSKAIEDFALVHVEHGDGSTISKEQIATAKGKASNLIEQDLLGSSEANYSQLPAWFWSTSVSNASVSKIQSGLEKEQHEMLPATQLKNFFQKDEQGISLYDRVKDDAGNIRPGAVAELEKSDSSPTQKSVLDFMDQNQSYKYWLFGDRGMSGDNLKKLVSENGLDFTELSGGEIVP